MGLNPRRTVLIFILFNIFSYLSASEGDRSLFYQKCVNNCLDTNCTDGGSLYKKKQVTKFAYNRELIIWDCLGDCRYHCMWRTVDIFESRGYRIPKFHGKWPFKRYLGIQEPAAVFASFLNLFAHIVMHVELTRRFPREETPEVVFWHIFALVCMNSWIMSMGFHTRDTPWSEFLDYACALSMILVFFASAVIRVFHKWKKSVVLVLLACLVFYVDYVRYLYSGKIDYKYTVLVNTVVGTVGSAIWFLWGWAQYRAGRYYTWRVMAFTLLSGITLSLELFDFPPYNNAWDAHALWHLTTAPLPVIFYKFIMDDLQYMVDEQKRAKSQLKTA